MDDIVVMNQHRISQSSHMGTYTGRYARVGYGTSRSTGISIGDVVFMYQGRPYIIFEQIADPNGVARLAKSTRKQLLTAIKATSQKVSKTTKINIEENASVNNKIVNCPRCSSSNLKDSRYCKNCGFRIDNKITDTNIGQSNTSTTQVNENELLTYKSTSYKMKIDYPINWTKVEQGLGKPLVIAFNSPKEDVYDRYLENVGIGIEQVSKQITLDQFVQFTVNDAKNKNLPDFKIIESVPTSLSGMSAHRLICDNQGYTNQWLFMIKSNESSNDNNNNAVYEILYQAETTKFPIYLPIAQKMINSFEFIG